MGHRCLTRDKVSHPLHSIGEGEEEWRARAAAALHLRMRRCGGGGGDGGRAICVRSVIVTHPLNRHIMPLREREKGEEEGGKGGAPVAAAEGRRRNGSRDVRLRRCSSIAESATAFG